MPPREMSMDLPFYWNSSGIFILTRFNFPEGALFNRANPNGTMLNRDKKALDKTPFAARLLQKVFPEKHLGEQEPETC